MGHFVVRSNAWIQTVQGYSSSFLLYYAIIGRTKGGIFKSYPRAQSCAYIYDQNKQKAHNHIINVDKLRSHLAGL